MKDITDDIRDSVLNDKDEMMDRRKIKIMGEDTHVPYDVFKEFMDRARYFETDDISDIKNNYKKMSEMKRPGMKMLKWTINTAKQSMKHKKFVQEIARLSRTYGSDYERITGQKISFWQKVKLKLVPVNAIYLTDMMLDNFERFENPLFTIEVFDINDRFGNKIKGVRVTEHFHNNMIYYEERELKTNEKLAEVKQGSKRPFVMVCQVLDSKPQCLLVKHMQDGGKKVPLAPMIS